MIPMHAHIIVAAEYLKFLVRKPELSELAKQSQSYVYHLITTETVLNMECSGVEINRKKI